MHGEKVLDNTYISISGNLVNKNKSFEWDIKRKFGYELKIKNALISVSDKSISSLLEFLENIISKLLVLEELINL